MNKPIGLPFKAELVPKVLNGTKSQTRRLPGIHNCRLVDLHTGEDVTGKMRKLNWNDVVVGDIPYPNGELIHFHVGIPGSMKLYGLIPRHEPGDIAWMREMWAQLEDGSLAFAATDKEGHEQWTPEKIRWKPSIHMPRKFSRWERPLKSVRIELIQDITGRDCVFEGIVPEYEIVDGVRQWKGGTRAVRQRFAELWDSINTSRGWAWELNRPVIVYDWKEE